MAELSCTLASESITLLLDFKERSISALAPPMSSKVTCLLCGCRSGTCSWTYGRLTSHSMFQVPLKYPQEQPTTDVTSFLAHFWSCGALMPDMLFMPRPSGYSK